MCFQCINHNFDVDIIKMPANIYTTIENQTRQMRAVITEKMKVNKIYRYYLEEKLFAN